MNLMRILARAVVATTVTRGDFMPVLFTHDRERFSLWQFAQRKLSICSQWQALVQSLTRSNSYRGVPP
jgi:hypothetical protein